MDLKKYVPTIFNIGKEENESLQVALSMFYKCADNNENTYNGMNGPNGYAPDVHELHNMLRENSLEFSRCMNELEQGIKDHYADLCTANMNNDYKKMIDIMYDHNTAE